MSAPAQPAIVSPRLGPPAGAPLLPIGLGLAMLCADGLLLAWRGIGQADFLAILHLALVGGLLPIALGAALQLSAATTGRALARPFVASGAATAISLGGGLLAIGFATRLWPVVAVGGSIVALSLAWLAPMLIGQVLRARPFAPLHLGVAFGAASFLCAAVLGTLLALQRQGLSLPSTLLLPWHLAAALGSGFAALLSGVSWQFGGMFAQLAYPSRRAGFWRTSLIAFGALLCAALAERGVGLPIAISPLVAALLIWAVSTTQGAAPPAHAPRLTAPRLGAILPPWQLALAALALAAGELGPALILASFAFALAEYGFLERILPFLVWRARMQPGARGGGAVPKLAEILPPRFGALLLGLFELSAVAAALGLMDALRLAGLLAAALSLRLLGALRHLRP
ncbi:MAG: hypothetical protein M0Z66_12325 [Thermaerobacter sp.]|nr:hypothetical protein [Thermaerobacter sp.]